jgi:glycosyltransferase involved in cell wall biosynthesis
LEHEFALCFEGRLSGELESLGARVHQLREVRASRPHSIRRARTTLRDVLGRGGYHQVVCHATWSQALFGRVVRRAGLPLVFWAHDALAGRHWTERWARRIEPDLVVGNSQYTASTLPTLYGNVPAVVVYAPLDVTREPLSAAVRSALRAQLKTPDDAVVIVQASRMQAWKGHSAVLEALGRLRARKEWIWWVIGGAQRADEGAYVETLAAEARHLGIADRVRWLGERDDVRTLLSAAELYCQANTAPEPFGIAYVEALAAGLPVIASRAGGASEIVDGSCGLLVPPGDADALAVALEQLIVDDGLRARLAVAAPSRARQLCDPQTQLRCLAGALTRIRAVGVGA